MQDLNDLYYFAKVVEAGGFAAAGRWAFPSRGCRGALPNWKNAWAHACCNAPRAN
jgi:hypothetical protein